jgi:hypothetical protein
VAQVGLAIPTYMRPRQKRTKPAEQPLHVGDIIDCGDHEELWARCNACESNRFEVVGAMMNGYCGLLVCVQCRRGGRRWPRPGHFQPGGRSLQD